MKTILLSINLMLAASTALAMVQIKSNQDKPWRVYLLSDWQNKRLTTAHEDSATYIGFSSQRIRPLVVLPCDYTNRQYTSVKYTHNWVSGSGGSGSEFDNWGNYHWDSMNGSTYTNGGRSGNMTWDWAGWGEEIGVYDDGATTTGFTNLLWIWDMIGNEHCDVVDLVRTNWSSVTNNYEYSGYHHEAYTRKADTIWHVQTGGKAIPGRQNLWQFSGSAWEILDKRAVPQFGGLAMNEITNKTQIVLKDLGALKMDGNLWLALPDCVDKDITPTVEDNDFYTFSVSGQKYPFYINLATSTTNSDLSCDVPEVCVGQTVTLGAAWQGGTPPATNIDSVWWHLPEKYVNQQSNYSSTCTTYVKNTDLLTNTSVQCWYVNLPGGDCSVRETLHFANGQNVNITAKGTFTVFRPSYNFVLDSAGPIDFDTNNGILSSGDVVFHATVTSTNFSGVLNWTQLIKRQAFGNGQWLQNTYGSYYLDNDPLYNTITDTNGNNVGTPPTNTPVGPGTIATIGFDDHPTIQCEPLNTWINDSFITYLVFKPDGDGIWVTLDRVDWGWSALVSWYFGWDFDTGSLTQPHDTDTDEFPVWPDVLHNSRN